MIRLGSFFQSVRYAYIGIVYALENNQNLRIQFGVAFLVILASIFFRVNAFEMGILGVMILLVIMAEMVNTSLEQMTDLIIKEHRREAEIAKDVAAGMVLLTAVGSVIVGILVFAPHVIRFFSRTN